MIKLNYEGIYVDILGNVALGTGQSSNLRLNDHETKPKKQATTAAARNDEKDTS